MSDKTIVVLADGKGNKQEFEQGHAERILKLKNNGGWELPDNSNFIFDQKNGLRAKPNKEITTKTK